MAFTLFMDRSLLDTKSSTEAVPAPAEKRGGKLLYKLFGLFLALALVPLLGAGFLVIHVGNSYIQKQIIGVKMGIAQKVASNVTSYLDDKRNTLSIIQKSSDFLSMNASVQAQVLNNVMNAYPMFMQMSVLNLRGATVVSVNRTTAQPINDRMEALNSIRSVGDYMGVVSRSAEGYPQMTIGVPIERIPGRPIGYLLGVVNLIDLSSLIKDLSIDQKGYVYIVDIAERRLVAHPDIQTLLSDDPPSDIRAAFYTPDENNSGAIEFTDLRGYKFLATFATVPRQNWRVFVQQPTSEAYRALTQMQQEISKVIIAVVFLTLLVAYFVSRWIATRVHTLQSIMGQLGEGNFDLPEVVPQSNDEFGSLTEKVLWMAKSLKDKTLKLMIAQKELQKWNIELERRVETRTKDLKEAQEQLIVQEKLAALGQMASVVGHELRNPLAVMNNSVYYLKTKLAPAGSADAAESKIEKHLSIIESEIAKSNTIIRDVLDFSRNRALNAVPRVMDDLVDYALGRIQIPTGVTVRKALCLGALQVPVDEDEIRQVLVNLMENACQAMTSGGTLTVGTKTYSVPGFEGVEVAISDTGCGIPQEHLAKIFAPFFTTKSRGTGLGLAVVKKIVDRHQGHLVVDSKVGEGTTFYIRLPSHLVAAIVKS